MFSCGELTVKGKDMTGTCTATPSLTILASMLLLEAIWACSCLSSVVPAMSSYLLSFHLQTSA